MDDFAGTVAIVTGGASGIGLATATALAAAGATVAINDRDATRVAEATATLGPRALAIPGDAASPDAAREAVAAVVAAHGRVDILVNCAGVFYLGPAEAVPVEAWRTVMAVDLDSAFFWSQQVAAQSMLARRAGAIVNVASAAAMVAGPGSVPYTTAKHGMIGLTRALAVEWGPYGIRVNALCPGLTETEMVRNAWVGRESAYAERLARIPTGTAATPEQQADAILFMASPRAASVNGLVMNVDGGTVALSSGYSVQHPPRD